MQKKLFCQRANAQKSYFKLSCERISIYVSLFVFKVLGLFPWKFNVDTILKDENQDNNKKNLLEIWKYGYLYNILMIIVSPTFCAMTINLGLWQENYVESNLVDKIEVSLMSYGVFLLVVVWVNYIWQQRNFVNNSNNLYSIYKNFEIYHRHIENYCYLFIIFVVHFFLCLFILFTGFFANDAFSGLLWFVPFFTSSWILMQYLIILDVIFQLFKRINHIILQLGNINLENYYRAALPSIIPLREFAIKDIVCVNHATMQLCDICDQVADFYAIPMLLIIIYFITTTTFNGYYGIVSLLFQKVSGLATTYWIIGAWFFLVAFDLVVFTLHIIKITREVCFNIY